MGKGNDTPILTDDDLAKFVQASTFSSRLEQAKKISTVAIEKAVARGLTTKSVLAAKVLFKYGETTEEKDLGLALLMKHYHSGNVTIVAAVAEILKRSPRRAAAAASVGTALADARRARIDSAQRAS